ncbi:hypothetical protein [Duganella sp.]|uniref:hypothetical protein n=1 Tax=Duganella sp. TaxID=1904440 RepID=UPI0031E19F1D
MRVDAGGPSALQLLQAQAEIEASNQPILSAAAAAQRSLAGRRAGHAHWSAAADAAQQPDLVLTPLHHGRLAGLQARLRMRQKRGASNAEANDNASEFEELLLMLETQAQSPWRPMIRASARKQDGDPGQQPGESPRDPWQRQHTSAPAPQAPTVLDGLVRDFIQRGVAAAGALEGALVDLRALKSDPAHSLPLVTAVMRIMREYLAQPTTTAPDKLAAVKQRLISLLPPPSAQAAPALRQLHLLLPVLLLNAARPRTSRQRALAIARLDVLLKTAHR